MNRIVQLLPLEDGDREQFILDNQESFNFGAMEEFGLRDNHFEEEGKLDLLFVSPFVHSKGIGYCHSHTQNVVNHRIDFFYKKSCRCNLKL